MTLARRRQRGKRKEHSNTRTPPDTATDPVDRVASDPIAHVSHGLHHRQHLQWPLFPCQLNCTLDPRLSSITEVDENYVSSRASSRADLFTASSKGASSRRSSNGDIFHSEPSHRPPPTPEGPKALASASVFSWRALSWIMARFNHVDPDRVLSDVSMNQVQTRVLP